MRNVVVVLMTALSLIVIWPSVGGASVPSRGAKTIFTSAQAGARTVTQRARNPWRQRMCRFQTVQRPTWSGFEVRLTIDCALRKWPSDRTRVLMIADRESSFYYHATNSSSGACGIFQHLPRYWPGRVASAPHWLRLEPSCYNARSNVIASLLMMHKGLWSNWQATAY